VAPTDLPSRSRVVVIGGGVIGAAIAYHLCEAGEKDVTLIEKSSLTEGATWHAAGLVGQFRSNQGLTRLMQDSVKLYQDLSTRTGQHTGWKQVGSLRVAASKDRWMELQRAQTAARSFDFDLQLLCPDEVRKIYPLVNTRDLFGAAFIADDGYVDPYSLTQSFAAGIRGCNGKIFEGVRVTGLIRDRNRITHVVTDQGEIETETVVNAAGIWARQAGWMAGIDLPAGLVHHQYLVTEKSDLIPESLPTFRDPDARFYAKPEPGALAVGGWERSTPPIDPVKGFDIDKVRHLFDGDTERMIEVFEPASHRIPVLNELGIRTIVNGPIPISPDGEPIMGPVPGLDNFFVACAFTSGIAAAGGAGKAMANWILEGDPGLDLWAFDVRRFGPLHSNSRFLHDRAVESYSRYYDIPWPGLEGQEVRGVRRSPLYTTLKNRGAVYGSKFGWERPKWFRRNAENVDPGWNRQGEENTIGFEHRTAREGVVMIDMSSFTKFEISGADSCAVLQHLSTANVDRPVGGGAYTQFCNENGGIEADVTVIRRSDDCFWVITGSALGVRDSNWIRSHAQKWGDVQIRDITSGYGVINLIGPDSRKVLEKVTDKDISDTGHPFMTARELNIGYAPALAFRVTYVGELGWELYIATEFTQYAYEVLQQAGEEYRITDIGYNTIDSLRLEKRYLAWGVDITPQYNPVEAGLDFVIDWSKPEFIGREALARIRDQGPAQKLVCLALDKPLAVFGGEAILVNGRPVGQATSGNYGYCVGKSLVLGYVPIEYTTGCNFEVEAFGVRSAASLINKAPYDPERKKILG
jgi:4-methylaminobutanoate oxidase (formaldehyde-forming)